MANKSNILETFELRILLQFDYLELLHLNNFIINKYTKLKTQKSTLIINTKSNWYNNSFYHLMFHQMLKITGIKLNILIVNI